MIPQIITLRGYQDELVCRARSVISRGSRSPCIVAPTGSGKTTIGAHIMQSGFHKGNPSMVVAHRQELVFQWSMTLCRFGIPHDLIASDQNRNQIRVEHARVFGHSFFDRSSPIKVGSIQTVHSRILTLSHFEPKIIIVDEGHHATEGSNYSCLWDRWPNAVKLSLTATPERLDGRGLGKGHGGYCDELILGPRVGWLIENGFLSQYRAFVPPKKFDARIPTRFGDYAKAQLETAVDKPSVTGDAIEHYLKYMRGEPAVVFCVSVKHAVHVAEQFQAAGVVSYEVSGQTSSGDRKERLDGLGNGSVQVITSADLIGEGVDIPNIRGVFLLRPTKSLGLHKQQIGRGLRPAPGKTDCLIFDHAGNIIEHGLPDTEIQWSLEGSKARRSTPQDLIQLRTCLRCFCIHDPAPICPMCGYIYQAHDRKVQEVIGDLRELEKEQEKALLEIRRKDARKAQGKARGLDELLRQKRSEGKELGTAWHIYMARAGNSIELAYNDIMKLFSEIDHELKMVGGDRVEEADLLGFRSDVIKKLGFRFRGSGFKLV